MVGEEGEGFGEAVGFCGVGGAVGIDFCAEEVGEVDGLALEG